MMNPKYTIYDEQGNIVAEGSDLEILSTYPTHSSKIIIHGNSYSSVSDFTSFLATPHLVYEEGTEHKKDTPPTTYSPSDTNLPPTPR